VTTDQAQVEEFFEALCFAGVYFLQGELLERGEVVVGGGHEWDCGWIIAWAETEGTVSASWCGP